MNIFINILIKLIKAYKLLISPLLVIPVDIYQLALSIALKLKKIWFSKGCVYELKEFYLVIQLNF